MTTPTGGDGEQGQPPGTVESATSASPTLADEHALLLREVTARAEALLEEADGGRWPDQQLHELVNYLQLELLRQIVEEEWLLFRTARFEPEGLARLRSEHLELRLSIDVLTNAAAGQRMPPAQLATVTRELLGQVNAHVANEERVLATAHTEAPATTTLGGQPHEWYDLTEGPVIDLDKLPGEQGADAVLARLLRLRPGEHVELHSSVEPGPLWQRVIRAEPGSYRVIPVERGPQHWRVELMRHGDRWTPHPYA